MLLQSPNREPPLFVSTLPISGEILDGEHLQALARRLAETHRLSGERGSGRDILARVRANGRALLTSYRSTARAIAEQRAISPAAEWLVDNFHVVDEQLREIKDDLPSGFYGGLPKLADGDFRGYPRVLALAFAYVEHTDSCLDIESLRQFVRAYQEVEPLTIGELWAIPLWLRLLLVENLRRLADGIVQVRHERERANAFADEVLAAGSPGAQTAGGSNAAIRLRKKPDSQQGSFSPPYAVELLQRLRDRDPATTPALRELDERFLAMGTTREEVAAKEHQRQAATHVSVRNVITSMRVISAEDWPTFFESVSLVDEVLGTNPGFALSDFATRDRCRGAIEELGRGSGQSEVDIAKVVADHAQRRAARVADPNHEGDARFADPAYYLISAGRRLIESAVSYRAPLRQRLRRLYANNATLAYAGAFLMLTGCILAAPVVSTGLAFAPLPVLIALAALGQFPRPSWRWPSSMRACPTSSARAVWRDSRSRVASPPSTARWW